MTRFFSDGHEIRMEQREPASPGAHPAVVLLHGAGGNVPFWFDRLGPVLDRLGVAAYAPHYFDRTGTGRATLADILDGRHVPAWLSAIRDGLSYVAGRPAVDAHRIAVLGVSLGGFLSISLAAQPTPAQPRLRALIEISGGLAPGLEERPAPTMPPTLLLHGTADTVVPVAEAHRLAAYLTRGGTPHQLELLPGEGHWFSPVAQARLLMLCGGFLARHL